jgi:hypothetical protein
LSFVIFEHCSNCWGFKEHFPHWLPCSSHNIYFIVSQGGLEVIKIICEDGMWHMDRCPLISNVMFCIAKKYRCQVRIQNQYTKNDNWDSNSILFSFFGLILN